MMTVTTPFRSLFPLAAVMLAAACTDRAPRPSDGRTDSVPAQPSPPTTQRADSVTIVFSRNESPVQVRRAVTGAPDLRTALAELVRGPTSEERAEAIWSWFSSATADVLMNVQVDATGHATIDFQDLRPLIPGASSSAGSTMLLQELNGTVFQFPDIRSVEYRIDGSCDTFWEWLQYACQTVRRPGP